MKSELPIRSISHSMIRDYLNCPKLFYYRYILNVKLLSKNINLIFGSAIHKAVENFYNDTDPFEGFNQEFKKEKITPFDEKEFTEHCNEGKRLIENFRDSIGEFERYHGITRQGDSEIKFREWFKDPVTGTLLRIQSSGRFDRLTHSGQLLEIKTSSKPYKQDEINEATQASMYMLARLMQTNEIPREFFYIIFIKGRKKDPIQVLRTTRTKEELSQFFQTIDLILKGIQGGQFGEGTGFMHKFCDCKEYEKALLIKT